MFLLKDLSLSLPVGGVLLVEGAPKSGKSALLQALLGNLHLVESDTKLQNGGNDHTSGNFRNPCRLRVGERQVYGHGSHNQKCLKHDSDS